MRSQIISSMRIILMFFNYIRVCLVNEVKSGVDVGSFLSEGSGLVVSSGGDEL